MKNVHMQDHMPLHQALHVLTDIDVRSRRAGRGSAMMEVKVDGVSMGRARFRSVVEEDDRVKFYGHSFFLLDHMVSEASAMESGQGVAYGVRMVTTCGIVEIECPPGLRHR